MNSTLWPKDPQTQGKHLILKHYLDGWFPILGSSNARLLFIDGFAGPGEYDNGDPGSPLIAMDCVKRHKAAGRLKRVDVTCLFIESDDARASHLRGLVSAHSSASETTCLVLSGSFDDHMTEVLDYLDKQKAMLAPAFVMIDPFGVKGSPMKLIGRILGNAKSECMISFMYEPIRRFRADASFEQHLDDLFGTREWRTALDMVEAEAKPFLHDLFSSQLKRHGARYVVTFELWRGHRHIYTVYFTSGNLRGCDLMKAAIWKVEPSGSYTFRGTAGQLRMSFETDTGPLANELQCRFGGQPAPIEAIERFVMSDKTMYHRGHLRQKTLQKLEREGRITVVRPCGGRGFPCNQGVVVHFH